MNFYELSQLLDNVNTRPVNPSGGAGINVNKPAGPQKGAVPPSPYSPGTKSPKNNEIKPSPFSVASKDDPKALKAFNSRPPSPMSLGTKDTPKPKPWSPMLPPSGPGSRPIKKDPTKLKQIEVPKSPGE